MADTLTSVAAPETRLTEPAEVPMTSIENVVRGLVIGGFAALLAYEVYLIWRALAVF